MRYVLDLQKAEQLGLGFGPTKRSRVKPHTRMTKHGPVFVKGHDRETEGAAAQAPAHARDRLSAPGMEALRTLTQQIDEKVRNVDDHDWSAPGAPDGPLEGDSLGDVYGRFAKQAAAFSGGSGDFAEVQKTGAALLQALHDREQPKAVASKLMSQLRARTEAEYAAIDRARGKPAPATATSPQSFGERFHAAFNRIQAGRDRPMNLVELSELRREVGGSRDEFDRGLYELRRSGGYVLHTHDGRHGKLPDAAREASIEEGGRSFAYVARRDTGGR